MVASQQKAKGSKRRAQGILIIVIVNGRMFQNIMAFISVGLRV
jgi:hypothetical protein